METLTVNEFGEAYTRAKPKYVVCVRSWFDKTYGNSYFTGRVWGGVEPVLIPFTYGDGNGAYASAAWVALGLAGEWSSWHDSVGLFGIECVSVSRRKDLHKGSL